MKTGKSGINLIKECEGCYTGAYKCPAGVWTIGYGHTGKVDGKAIAYGMKITKAKAEELLKEDLRRFERHVDGFRYQWTQNQFDALVSFAFNVGSITQLTANGTRTIKEIALKIPAYNKAGGKVLAGLTKRRKMEQELFLRTVSDEMMDQVKLTVATKTSPLVCRAGANKNSDVIGKFAKGAEVTLLNKATKNWYKVRGKGVNGKTITGFCAAEYLVK